MKTVFTRYILSISLVLFVAGCDSVSHDTHKPTITLLGDANATLTVGEVYTDAGATAWDDVDGNLTNTIHVVSDVNSSREGNYTVTYTVSDAAGNAADPVIRAVHVLPIQDHTPPVITLLGHPDVNLTMGEIYVDAGATAWDDVDGNLTDKIQVISDVNSSKRGSYGVRYTVSDAAGNSADEVRRTVTVQKEYGKAGIHPTDYQPKESTAESTVYFPADLQAGEKVPVVFFASGWHSNAEAYKHTDYSTLLRFIASQGYYVIYLRQGWLNDRTFPRYQEALDRYADHIDTTRIGVVGHSLGGGNTFKILDYFSKEKGYGENGRFIMVIEGWYAWEMNQADMKNLPPNTHLVMQQYGPGGNNAVNDTDPRIVLTEYYMLDSIPAAQKDYQVYADANHTYPYGDRDYGDMQIILKPLDALMDYTFNHTAAAHDIALEIGNDDPYADGHGIQEVKPQNAYGNKCDGSDTHTDIDYCAFGKKYPPTQKLQPRATDDTIRRPAVGNPTHDNVYGTTIAIVNKSDNALSNYPKVQSWNSDMTLIRIGSRLYNAATLEETNITKNKTSSEAYNTLCARSSDYFRWSHKEPDTFYVVNSDHQFIEGKIQGNTVDCSAVLDPFDEYEVVHMGPHEGNIDNQDTYVVFSAKKPNDTTFYVVLYDIAHHARVWTKIMQNQQWEQITENGKSVWKPSTLDWISVSQSGKYIVFNNQNGNKDGMYRYDINLTNKVKLQYKWEGDGQLYSEGGHGDIGYDTDGHEVFVQFISGVGVYSFNLDTPSELGKQLLSSPYGGGHISCRNTQRKGWCYVTANADSNGDGLRDVFALKIDGTGEENVQHFSQTHIRDHYSETYGSPSPDGTKVIFNSHWGADTIGTFIAEVQ